AEQGTPVRLGGDPHQARVDVGAGQHHPDAYPALSGLQQRAHDQLVGDEVGGGEVDGVLGGRDGHQEHQVHALAAARGRGDEQVRLHVPGRLQRREIVGTVEHAAGGLDPVVVEGGLDLGHHRSVDAEVDVAPVVRVRGAALPLVGDAAPAGEADPAVHHQQLAVGAVVHPAEVVPVQRAVTLDLDAGVLHQVQ